MGSSSLLSSLLSSPPDLGPRKRPWHRGANILPTSNQRKGEKRRKQRRGLHPGKRSSLLATQGCNHSCHKTTPQDQHLQPPTPVTPSHHPPSQTHPPRPSHHCPTQTHTHTHKHTQTQTHTLTYAHKHTHTHTCTCTHIHTHTHT